MASEVEQIARRKSGDEGDDGDDKPMSSYGDVEDNAANDLFDALGVDEGDRAQAKSALSDYVKACVEKALDEQE